MHTIITIDGPVASGKSTVAQLLAKKLNAYYLYSGLLYRGLAYLLSKEQEVPVDFDESVKKPLVSPVRRSFNEGGNHGAYESDITHHADILLQGLSYNYNPQGGAHVTYKQHVLDGILKSSTIDQTTSLISQNKIIRNMLSDYQKKLVADKKIAIIEGRDAGTIVFPQSDYKFFITADPETRAKRWQKDQEKYNNFFSFEEALAAITQRDQRDSNREYAPLKQALDSIIVDTTHLDIEQTLKLIQSFIKR